MWIDHTKALGGARVASREMAAVPGVGATITHSSLSSAWIGITTHMDVHTIRNDCQCVIMMRDVPE